jgi:hypothetical protein
MPRSKFAHCSSVCGFIIPNFVYPNDIHSNQVIRLGLDPLEQVAPEEFWMD